MNGVQYVIPGLDHFFQLPASDSSEEKSESNINTKNDLVNKNLEPDHDDENTLGFNLPSE